MHGLLVSLDSVWKLVEAAISVSQIVVSFRVVRFESNCLPIGDNRIIEFICIICSDALIVIRQAQRNPRFGIVGIEAERVLQSFQSIGRSIQLEKGQAQRMICSGQIGLLLYCLLLCGYGILISRSEEHTSELQSRLHLVC